MGLDRLVHIRYLSNRNFFVDKIDTHQNENDLWGEIYM